MTPDRNLQKRNLVIVPALAIAAILTLPQSALSQDCSPKGASQALNHTTVEKHREGAWMQPTLLIVGSDEDWNASMNEMVGRNEIFILPAPAAPQADWSREMVILISLGTCPTSGYDVEITGVTRSGRRAILTVNVTTPVSDNMQQTLTMPYHIVRIPRNGLNSVEICYGSVEASADPQSVWPGLATRADVSGSEGPLTAKMSWSEVKVLAR
jgi:hypothetical protein